MPCSHRTVSPSGLAGARGRGGAGARGRGGAGARGGGGRGGGGGGGAQYTGGVAQLGERVNGIHEVRGSIPLASTGRRCTGSGRLGPRLAAVAATLPRH